MVTGLVDAGEDITAAAEREVLEETGVRASFGRRARLPPGSRLRPLASRTSSLSSPSGERKPPLYLSTRLMLWVIRDLRCAWTSACAWAVDTPLPVVLLSM